MHKFSVLGADLLSFQLARITALAFQVATMLDPDLHLSNSLKGIPNYTWIIKLWTKEWIFHSFESHYFMIEKYSEVIILLLHCKTDQKVTL